MKGNDILEKEVKIIGIEKDDIIGKLESNRAKKIFDGEIDMIFMDTQNAMLKKGRKTLRIRKKVNSLDGSTDVEVTLKIKTADTEKESNSKLANIREEYEFHSGNFQDTVTVFEKMGYRIRYRIKKHRISYEWDDATFELDKYNKIPWIMEIESENVENIRKSAGRLGFPPERLLPWSLSELLRHYEIEKTDRIE